MQLWYRVSDVESARDFYTRQLGFKEVYFDEDDRWVRLDDTYRLKWNGRWKPTGLRLPAQ